MTPPPPPYTPPLRSVHAPTRVWAFLGASSETPESHPGAPGSVTHGEGDLLASPEGVLAALTRAREAGCDGWVIHLPFGSETNPALTGGMQLLQHPLSITGGYRLLGDLEDAVQALAEASDKAGFARSDGRLYVGNARGSWIDRAYAAEADHAVRRQILGTAAIAGGLDAACAHGLGVILDAPYGLSRLHLDLAEWAADRGVPVGAEPLPPADDPLAAEWAGSGWELWGECWWQGATPRGVLRQDSDHYAGTGRLGLSEWAGPVHLITRRKKDRDSADRRGELAGRGYGVCEYGYRPDADTIDAIRAQAAQARQRAVADLIFRDRDGDGTTTAAEMLANMGELRAGGVGKEIGR